MKILFVAMGNSVHTARWVKQLCNKGWDIHLFPSIGTGSVYPDISGVTIHRAVSNPHFLALVGHSLFNRLFGQDYRTRQLARLINKLRPDVIHSLEIQHAGYLVDEVRKQWKGEFPKWLVTNWGSDIYLFGQLEEHKDKIRSVLSHCDYYSCECQRDIDLARESGFKGKIMPVVPNAGGMDLELVKKLRAPGKTSKRKVIALKGYQGWAGRALVGLRALERCSDLLKGFEIVIYSADEKGISGVQIAAKLFSAKTGVPTSILPLQTPHEEILKLHGMSRVSIGLSISDAISTSFLESLVMGSFPIQSDTSCANEWIECGKSGFLVPPEDPEIIERKIRIALTDDKLVDTAADINWETAKKRLGQKIVKDKAIEMYNTMLKE
ncbi:MAG: glycosyltransferase [Candidatus Levyibacteriota bacterium]